MNAKVRATIYEMLSDRGYHHIEDDTPISIIAKNEHDKRVIIYYVTDPKVSVKKIKDIKLLMENDNNGYDTLILVYKTTITSFAKQFILTDMKVFVQAFSEKELMFNITKHEYVPKHEIISNKEKQEILSRYKVGPRQLPCILSSDPVCRYFGAKPGIVFKITRPSPTIGTYTSYRIVV